MDDKQLLQRLQRGERLHSAVLRDLAFRKGLITVSDVTNMDSPPGEKEYLFINITERGRRLLENDLTDAILKHGPPTSAIPGFRLKPEHKAGFQNAEWACKHLVDKLGTPNLRFHLFSVHGELTAVCAECRPTIENANLIVK